MPEPIQEDHFPEVANKATRRIELLGSREKLLNPHDRREFFKTVPDERFKKMLGYINSITRGQQLEYNYKDGQFPMDPTPSLEDKNPLMLETFNAVRSILNNADIDDKTALQRAGLTLAGAVNYIHPYEDGNGRVGRVAHYIIEFGNERGDKAFEEELYAIIAKLPMYDTDVENALNDTPPPELDFALRQNTQEQAETDNRKRATQKVRTFLDMMQGKTKVPIQTEAIIPIKENNQIRFNKIPPGGIDGVQLYLKSYLALSSVPNRKPEEIPSNASRVLAQRRDASAPKINISIDLI